MFRVQGSPSGKLTEAAAKVSSQTHRCQQILRELSGDGFSTPKLSPSVVVSVGSSLPLLTRRLCLENLMPPPSILVTPPRGTTKKGVPLDAGEGVKLINDWSIRHLPGLQAKSLGTRIRTWR